MNRKDPLDSQFAVRAAALAVAMIGLALTATAQSWLEARVESVCVCQGKWPCFKRGYACDVKVAGGRAYVALEFGGLAVFDLSDVSNPTNCVLLGGYKTSGNAAKVAVTGNYAYVVDPALQIIDVSDPTRCRRVGGIDFA